MKKNTSMASLASNHHTKPFLMPTMIGEEGGLDSLLEQLKSEGRKTSPQRVTSESTNQGFLPFPGANPDRLEPMASLDMTNMINNSTAGAMHRNFRNSRMPSFSIPRNESLTRMQKVGKQMQALQ